MKYVCTLGKWGGFACINFLTKHKKKLGHFEGSFFGPIKKKYNKKQKHELILLSDKSMYIVKSSGL